MRKPCPVQFKRPQKTREARTIGKAVDVLESLSPNIRAHFRQAALQQSITVLRVAAVLLDETADKKGKRGRPNKTRRSQAEKVTDAVAPYYEVQTGKAPTEHNREFTKLMNNVYKILGIKAAGHSQAAARTARINQQK